LLGRVFPPQQSPNHWQSASHLHSALPLEAEEQVLQELQGELTTTDKTLHRETTRSK